MELVSKETLCIILLLAALLYVIWKIYRTDYLSKQRLAAIEAAGDGIGIVDADHRLVYINQAMKDLHRIEDVSNYIGKNWENLYTDKGKEQIRSIVMPALARSGSWRGESSIVAETGLIIPTELFLSVLPRGGFIGTARDISQRKRAEAEKEELHKKFVQAQKMEIVGALTGGIAHDFNNMLTVITGNIDMLQDHMASAPPAAKQHIQAVTRAAKRGAELTQRLLAFSRQQILAPEIIDVNTLIPHTIGMMKRTLGQQIEIVFEPGSDLWPVSIDAGQMENALLNLCINSRDAMRDGGTITITTENISSDDERIEGHRYIVPAEYIRICVSDTGEGISDENLNRVFDPFFTTKEVGEGSGLGLSMVYGFTKQSGGYVVISSVVGQGTQIALYFPKSNAALSQKQPDDENVKSAPRIGRVLFVEDEPDVRDYGRNLLADLGYEVREAQNGAQALLLLDSMNELDILVTALDMPGGIGGLDLAEEASAKFPRLKIMYVAGFIDGAQNGILQKQQAVILPKPYTRESLADKLKSLA